MINQDKPDVGIPQTELNIGSGYNLLVGGVFKLVVGALGNVGLINTSKVSVGETWGSITSTWATESRTWLAASQLFTNPSKPTNSLTNESKPA
jgi:hypothetical protein